MREANPQGCSDRGPTRVQAQKAYVHECSAANLGALAHLDLSFAYLRGDACYRQSFLTDFTPEGVTKLAYACQVHAAPGGMRLPDLLTGLILQHSRRHLQHSHLGGSVNHILAPHMIAGGLSSSKLIAIAHI